MIDYFRRPGITAPELMPVAQLPANLACRKRMGAEQPSSTGLALLVLFTPRHASQLQRALDEFRDAVGALHAAGIEVIRYRAGTIARNDQRPTVSLRGIDNRSYYWIRDDGDYHNWTGCGNTLNLGHPGVVSMPQCLRFGLMNATSTVFASTGVGDGAYAGISSGRAAV